jgi:hypothetical protein
MHEKCLELVGNSHPSFWESFWPNLWSGIISGIITGFAVGFVIWFLQKRRDERRFKRDLLIEWSAFKEDLRVALSRRDVMAIDSLAALPASTKGALDCLKGKPIGTWHRELLEHKTEIARILELQDQRDRFITGAEELAVQIRMAVRDANRDVWEGQDKPCIRYINGRVYGATEEQVAPWLGQPNLPVERLREVADRVLEIPEIATSIQQYSELRSTVVAATTQLRSAIEQSTS